MAGVSLPCDCRHAEIITDTPTNGVSMRCRRSFASHETMKHSAEQYVRDDVHTNSAEGYSCRKPVPFMLEHLQTSLDCARATSPIGRSPTLRRRARGIHRPNHCVFPAIGTGFGEKDGAICACPSRTREKPFPTLFPWGSRAPVQHRDCCRLSTAIGGRSRRMKASKQKNPLFLLLRGADAAAHGKMIAPRSCLGIAQASIESPFVIRA